MDRLFVLSSLFYAIIGMILGIFMAASKNHGEMVTHAHIMLVGFVVSFIYGLCHKLWLNNIESGLVWVQFSLHQVGAAVLSIGLFLLYGNFISLEVIDPVLAIASVVVLVSMVIMMIMFIKSYPNTIK